MALRPFARMNTLALSHLRHRIKSNLTLLLTFAAISSIAITYSVIATTVDSRKIGPNPYAMWALIGVDFLLLSALAALVGGRLWAALNTLRGAKGGSVLQRRVVSTFATVTIVPALLITLFSVLFFNLGIQVWFNQRVNTAVEESLAVAEAYVSEHRENIRTDAIDMANDLEKPILLAQSNPVEFNRLVSAQSELRVLAETLVFQRNRIIAQGRFSFALAFESLPQDAIERAKGGEVVLLPNQEDKMRALIRIPGADDTYLLIGRLIDSKVIAHMKKTQGAVNEYRNLKRQLTKLKVVFSIVFVIMVLLLLLMVVWWGLYFAARLTTPVAELMQAAERIRGGDFSARVEARESDDELANLGRTFNRMGDQLEAQRRELIEANRELDERRRFSEAVLAGVSAGVIALDAEKRVRLTNRPAAHMLGLAEFTESTPPLPINSLLPGIHELLAETQRGPDHSAQGAMQVQTGNRRLTLHVRILAERAGEHIVGYIVTLDDITPLAAAQRQAAWSDVARRVAHEIKNPLTPISLAAERLKRKYAKFITEAEEHETFVRYTDTISRHVGDIGRMVEEFVGFARMPAPVFKEETLAPIIQKVLFSEQVAHPDITYHFTPPDAPILLKCDERQLSQGLSNILKNAAEAIEQKTYDGESPYIRLALECAPEQITLTITDNGPGFPPALLAQATDPYVTTRAKGMGLGLAIVKKIVEDHGGTLTLANKSEGGAIVTLCFLQHCDINTSNVSG